LILLIFVSDVTERLDIVILAKVGIRMYMYLQFTTDVE